MGIEGELLPNVFELFEQRKRSLDRSQGGLGVGLTLVHRLVALHQGTVTATSAGAGLGSEFRITLPCLSEVGDTEAPAATAPLDATAMFLKLGGNEVKAVGNGSDALASAPVFEPDVVLLDIGLPGMDGYGVAGRLRELAATRASCLIALTGYGQPADRERAREAGFDHHLTKPADPDELLALIAAWMRSRAPGRGQGEPERRSPRSGG